MDVMHVRNMQQPGVVGERRVCCVCGWMVAAGVSTEGCQLHVWMDHGVYSVGGTPATPHGVLHMAVQPSNSSKKHQVSCGTAAASTATKTLLLLAWYHTLCIARLILLHVHMACLQATPCLSSGPLSYSVVANTATLSQMQNHRSCADICLLTPPSPTLLHLHLCCQVMDEIVLRTAHAMVSEGCPFRGVLFAGLMIKNGKAKLLEHNVRWGLLHWLLPIKA